MRIAPCLKHNVFDSMIRRQAGRTASGCLPYASPADLALNTSRAAMEQGVARWRSFEARLAADPDATWEDTQLAPPAPVVDRSGPRLNRQHPIAWVHPDLPPNLVELANAPISWAPEVVRRAG